MGPWKCLAQYILHLEYNERTIWLHYIMLISQVYNISNMLLNWLSQMYFKKLFDFEIFSKFRWPNFSCATYINTLQACKSLRDTCVWMLEIHKNLMLLLSSSCLYNNAQEVCHTYFIRNLRCFSIMFNIVNFILCALGRDLLKSFKLLLRLHIIIIKQYISLHNFPTV